MSYRRESPNGVRPRSHIMQARVVSARAEADVGVPSCSSPRFLQYAEALDRSCWGRCLVRLEVTEGERSSSPDHGRELDLSTLAELVSLRSLEMRVGLGRKNAAQLMYVTIILCRSGESRICSGRIYLYSIHLGRTCLGV